MRLRKKKNWIGKKKAGIKKGAELKKKKDINGKAT